MDNMRVFLTKQEIAARVQEIAKKLASDYKDELHIVCILKGAFVFCSDLMRAMAEIKGPKITIDFLYAKSYSEDQSSGNVRIEFFEGDVNGKEVLVVEDIVDTGLTIKQINDVMMSRGATTVKFCTLLDKPSRRTVEVKLDYVGFEIPNNYAVGYGMDFEELYRELDYIAIMD